MEKSSRTRIGGSTKQQRPPMKSSSSRTAATAVVLIDGVTLQPKYSCQHAISVIETNRPQTP